MDDAPERKRCTKCGEEKPLEEFSKTKRDGVLSHCKECLRQYARERYKKPEVKARMQAYYSRPDVLERYRERYKRPDVKERRRDYYQRPEVIKRVQTYMQEYHRHPVVEEREREWRKEYRKRPEIQERTKEYRQQPEVKESDRLYAQKYRQSLDRKERLAEYYRTPAAKFLKINREHRRRSRKLHAVEATDEPITQEQWLSILKLQKNICPDCGKRFTRKNPATMDHIVPLSIIPLHSSDNIRAVCAGCNARKRDRLVQGYIQTWLYTNKEPYLQKL